jgi:protease-4
VDADAILDRRRLKRRLTFWRIAAVVVLAALIGVAGARFLPRDQSHVVRLNLDGFIGEDREREEAIRELADDDDVRAVIVRINSPGGTTTGSEEIFVSLRHVAEKKPVVAVIGTIGASGGYIAALAADRIFARETSLTGSIGVLFQTAEFTGLLDKLGVKAESIKSSPLKGSPSPLEPMTEETRAAFRELLADGYAWFSDLVRTRRNLSPEETRAVADGRVFSGRQARDLKLIDALGGEPAARAWLSEQHGVSTELDAVDLHWGPQDRLVNRMFDSLAGKLFANKPLTLDGMVSVWQPR